LTTLLGLIHFERSVLRVAQQGLFLQQQTKEESKSFIDNLFFGHVTLTSLHSVGRFLQQRKRNHCVNYSNIGNKPMYAFLIIQLEELVL
jgi:hypothetical protein